ncbi:MAG: WD40 repeat domain-containing protein [Rhizobiales bacterium]|nr:WD40 repeat domain-containing protein [Hyphomicrobiales bacterium]
MPDADRTAIPGDRLTAHAAGQPVVGAAFLDGTAAFALAEGEVLLVAGAAPRRVPVHDGGVLATATNGRELVTGGDDGKVSAVSAEGTVRVVATDERRRWIDQVAVAGDAVAWSAGKTASVRQRDGEPKSLDLPSSVGGIAFAPKGFRLALAHYNGVSLWFPNAGAKPEFLEWHGSHLGASFSPDGKFLVTAMQEPMLHGWRLADAKHMRMSGYSAKVRSLSWSADGKWLATSGSEQLILWPFQGKDGPMGKQPRMLAPMQARVVAVAFHPASEIVAVGYADGLVILVRLADGAEVAVRRPDGQAVTALVWSARGDRLAFGTEGGEAGIARM